MSPQFGNDIMCFNNEISKITKDKKCVLFDKYYDEIDKYELPVNNVMYLDN